MGAAANVAWTGAEETTGLVILRVFFISACEYKLIQTTESREASNTRRSVMIRGQILPDKMDGIE